MKKILFLICITLNIAFAQIPQAFNYQGVARDGSGTALSAKSIKVRLSILSEKDGLQSVLYSETHTALTNQFGLFVLPVGKGTIVSGSFATIPWTDSGKKLLKTEIDPDNNGYSLSGTSDLQSVPFALTAKTVETENQKLNLAGNLLSISQGNSVDLSSISGNSQWENNSVGINFNKGRVGIGTNTPGTMLHIVGNFTLGDRNPIELVNTSNSQDAICGLGLTVGTNHRGGIQMYNDTYFPTGIPEWSGRLKLGAISKNGILIEANSSSGTNCNIELATGPLNGQIVPVRMIVGYNGNVGIGTTTPTQKLDVAGKLRVQDLSLDNTATKVVVADAAGILGYKDISSLGSASWTNLADGINYNSGRVLVGDPTASHIASLIVSKNATGADRNLFVTHNTSNANDAANHSRLFAGTDKNIVGIELSAYAKSYFPNLATSGFGVVRSEKLALLSSAKTNTPDAFISFMTGANEITDPNGAIERMRIDYLGNVGIGTTAPKATLHVKGSVFVEDAEQGMIMKSASGQCWRVTVGDTGTLTSAAVPCP